MTTSVGRVTAVVVEPAGSSLSEDALTGETSLSVVDAYDFNEAGGQIVLGDGTTLTYTSADQESDVLTLSAPLISDLWVQGDPDGDNDYFVAVYPRSNEFKALVDFNDSDEGISANIPLTLQAYLSEGVRDPGFEEMVTVSDESGRWMVVEVADQLRIPASAINLDDGPITDGVPPSVSPPATVSGGINTLFVQWDPVANIDPITYEVHVSLADGFIPDASTLAGESQGGSLFVIKQLPDSTPLDYATTYYVRIVAKDVDGAASPGDQGSGSPKQIDTPDIAVGAVTADQILANQVTADKLESVLALLSELYVGDKISITPPDGIRIDLNNGGYIHFPSDGSAAELIKVIARFTEVVVEDDLTINGANNKVAGALTLNQSVPPPSNAPVVTSVDDPSGYVAVESGYTGLGYDGTQWKRGKVTFTPWNINVPDQPFTLTVRKYNKTTGAASADWTFVGTHFSTSVVLCSVSSSAAYDVAVLYFNDDIGFLEQGPSYSSGPAYLIVTRNNSTGVKNSFLWGSVASWRYPAVYTDGANIYVSATNKSSNLAYMYRYTMAGGSQTTMMTSSVALGAVNLSALYYGSADWGANRSVILTTTGIYVYNGNARSSGDEWTKAAGEVLQGIAWDGTNFFTSHNTNKIRKYSTLKATISRAVKYTWRNVAASTRSTASPVANADQAARKWLQVVTDSIPTSSDPSAPDAVSIYIDAHRQTDPAAGDTNETYEIPTTGGSDSPGVDGFASLGNAGAVLSEGSDADGALIDLEGDGSWRMGRTTGDATGMVRPSGEIIHLSTGTAQNVLTGTWTQASFGLDVTTPGRERDIAVMLAANSSGVLIGEDGWYRADGMVNFATTSVGGRCLARLVLAAAPGSAASGAGFCYSEVSFVSGVSIAHALGMPFYATAGQHLRLEVWQNSGATQSITTRHLIATRV